MEKEDQVIEPTLDVEISPMMETASALVDQTAIPVTPPSRYWQAQGLADLLQREFDEAHKQGHTSAMREKYYPLATYYNRTLAILHYALKERREPLTQASLHNLIALHKALYAMHKAAPTTIPSPLTLSRELRPRLMETLLMQILQEAPHPLTSTTITHSLNSTGFFADTSEQIIRRNLNNLALTGHVQSLDEKYTCTSRPYSATNLDQVSLQVMAGSGLYQQLDQVGFHGLSDMMAHKNEFRSRFIALTGFSDGTAALMLAATEALSEGGAETKHLSSWQHANLIGAPHLRPYQYEAYTIFRSYGYQGQVIEAPTGSGKTMIGMMCIQDWLRSMAQGQAILVLVPTVNYQQQWAGELCYKPLGLRLSPHQVYTGTPANLEKLHKRSGFAPCVIVMTYTALAQTGSGVGKGGFDQNSIEIFLQGNNIQHVIFDEVHKVVEDMHSVSADVTHLLMDWVQDGSLKGAIGFSGTAASYRSRFAELGLQLVYVMPAAELIAYGFVAPFAELGVPFAYSEREQRIRALLDSYKTLLRDFIALVGSDYLRRQFAAIPIEQRLGIARNLLRMFANQKNQEEALLKRFKAWEEGRAISLSELPLITMIQLANRWSDEDLVRAAQENEPASTLTQINRFSELLNKLNSIRAELRPLIYLPESVRRLSVERFGTTFDTLALEAMLQQTTQALSQTARAERVKDALATTITGLYDSLSDWYMRVGEGRVDSIKAIIEAERASRPIHAIIIFDAGTRIRWQSSPAVPGYGGVAGVFSQMLGDARFTPMAVLSSEMYLPYAETDSLPIAIADFIKREIMIGELGEALFGLTTQGLDLSDEQVNCLRTIFNEILAQYVNELGEVKVARPGEFQRKVLAPFRKAVRNAKLGSTRDKLLARLSLKHYHIRDTVATFFDYALIVDDFLNAHVAELIQVSGTHQKFFVVKMAVGERKQLMYDLTARIVDAENLPINMIIVSPWARTGWNVIKPNLLIDATATRDVTAWQQLRGRAMRAMRTWTNECYRLIMLLMSSRPLNLNETTDLPEDVLAAFEEFRAKIRPTVLDETSKNILLAAHTLSKMGSTEVEIEDILAARIEQGDIAACTLHERTELVAELMLARNKVTHIYELVKAYGSTSQIHYDRATHEWLRTESIAAKHAREFAVNPLTGQYLTGAEHAPLVYASDPRKDIPSALEMHLISALKNSDQKIVQGWLRAIAPDERD